MSHVVSQINLMNFIYLFLHNLDFSFQLIDLRKRKAATYPDVPETDQNIFFILTFEKLI